MSPSNPFSRRKRTLRYGALNCDEPGIDDHAPNFVQILRSAIREAEMLKVGKGYRHLVQMLAAYRSESGRCVRGFSLSSLAHHLSPLRVYIVLEYIPNVLSTIIHKQRKISDGGLPQNSIWDITEQLLHGVRFLHRQKVGPACQVCVCSIDFRSNSIAPHDQIIHRDLKPSNVMVTDDGESSLFCHFFYLTPRADHEPLMDQAW